MPESIGLDNILVVCTTPEQRITFYADDPGTHKRTLTIRNPYDYEMKFKILVSTADHTKYSVTKPQGFIEPKKFIEVVLHHHAAIPSNVGTVDKLRVLLSSGGPGHPMGKKDIDIVLLENAARETVSGEAERFQQLEASPGSLGYLRQQPLTSHHIHDHRGGGNNKVIYIVAFILGVIILAMPKEGEFNEYFPNAFPRPTSEMKFMVTYLLGIVTVLLLQS